MPVILAAEDGELVHIPFLLFLFRGGSANRRETEPHDAILLGLTRRDDWLLSRPPWTGKGSSGLIRQGREGGKPMDVLDLAAFSATPLVRQPFEYLIVPGFIRREARAAINAAYPRIKSPGSFPASELAFGPAFGSLLEALQGPAIAQGVCREVSNRSERSTHHDYRPRAVRNKRWPHPHGYAQQDYHGINLPEPKMGAGGWLPSAAAFGPQHRGCGGRSATDGRHLARVPAQ